MLSNFYTLFNFDVNVNNVSKSMNFVVCFLYYYNIYFNMNYLLILYVLNFNIFYRYIIYITFIKITFLEVEYLFFTKLAFVYLHCL